MKTENISNYPRDMKGYGESTPKVTWPNKARVAVQFVINYEEGAENCILHGDKASETFLSEIIGALPFENERHMNMESFYEYGSRAGFWRLHRLFTQRNMPVTVFGVAMAMQRNPEAVEAMLKADWEIASHGYRWIDYQKVPIETEREHLKKAIKIHEKMTGEKPKGWYLGRMSENTRKLVIEEGSFLYDADSYADDLPYYIDGNNGTDKSNPHLIVPYTLDVNDMRFASPQGFNSGDQFFCYLKDTFDTLYEEGRDAPKMMSIGLHCRIIGRPGRFASLVKFLNHIDQFDDVWVCRRKDIAEHWLKHHSPK
ncbi:allantoinase PuuE [Psychrobium sp. nBUS_13]|uniref:allantoinase PuuE n=1 Tax=Psychrobium sp. nBUS_13 TaxID=3395319 RepID=UPI003EC0B6CC